MVISLDRWLGKTAIVTGASAGIGAAVSEALVNAGIKVVGLARRKDRIEALAKKLSCKKGKLYALQADMTNEQDIKAAFEWTKKNVGPIHILVNNAGSMGVANLIDGDTEIWKRTLDLNVLGLCIATREAIKDMRANNVDGHIIHINSIAGHYVPRFEGLNVYPASKHAVTALTESLRHELNSIGSKIRITSISPGYVATEFLDASGYTQGPPQTSNNSSPALKPEDVADAILYVLGTPPHVQIHDIMMHPIGEQM